MVVYRYWITSKVRLMSGKARGYYTGLYVQNNDVKLKGAAKRSEK